MFTYFDSFNLKGVEKDGKFTGATGFLVCLEYSVVL